MALRTLTLQFLKVCCTALPPIHRRGTHLLDVAFAVVRSWQDAWWVLFGARADLVSDAAKSLQFQQERISENLSIYD